MKRQGPKKNGNGVPAFAAATEHDQLIARLLRNPKKAEAMSWLESVKHGKRTIGPYRKTATSAKLVRKLYRLGASEVIAAQIQPARNGVGQHTVKLVIKLSKEAQSRKAFFDWCQKQGDSLGFSPDLDQGQSHLFLLLG